MSRLPSHNTAHHGHRRCPLTAFRAVAAAGVAGVLQVESGKRAMQYLVGFRRPLPDKQ